MIEKHDSNTYLFQESEEFKEKERGNENYRFYNRFLKKQLSKIMDKKNYGVRNEKERINKCVKRI